METKMERILLEFQEPNDALLSSFSAKARVERKRDIEADPTSKPEKCYQITDFFMSRCGLEALRKQKKWCAASY